MKFYYLLFMIIITLLPSFVEASDMYKSYLHNPSIPDHPELNIQGILATDLWIGATTYQYPIEVPPGRNNLQPEVFLSYNHEISDQISNLFGRGWRWSGDYILRELNYSYSADKPSRNFKLILERNTYDLVYDPSDEKYHTKIESFLSIKNFSNGNNTDGQYWIVKKQDGTMYRFGYNFNSELNTSAGYASQWHLDLINDTHNNQIYYTYGRFFNQYNHSAGIYPLKIEYNNEKSRLIEFILEDRTDIITRYLHGSEIIESKKVKEIQIKANSNLVKKYVFNYTLNEPKTQSLLSSITVYGNDGVTSFSPIIFEYYNVTKGWKQEDKYLAPITRGFGGTGHDYGYRLVDLNRDGLIDIVGADKLNPSFNESWISNGTGWTRNDSWNVPDYIVDEYQVDTGMRFVDFNGDGLIDIVRGDGSLRKSWQNTGNGWILNSTWNLPTNTHPIDKSAGIFERGVRFVDFNGDGLIDIYSSTDDWQYSWKNTGNGWILDYNWSLLYYMVFNIYPSGKDEGIRLEDINNDGLVDVIKAKAPYNSSNVFTYINTGDGSWSLDTALRVPSDALFVNESGADMGVRIADINGDDLPDILKGSYLGNQSAWINNGSGWVNDTVWNIHERAFFVRDNGGNVGVRLVDANGDGSVDIMHGGDHKITYLNKNSYPYLLKRVLNSAGGSHNISYLQSSLLNNTGKDNIPDLGFNIWVTDNVLNNDGMEKKNIINYQYAGGFYDYRQGEFRGFNKASEIRPNISIIIHQFHQNDSLKGKEFKTEVFDIFWSPYQREERLWRDNAQGAYYITNLDSESTTMYDGVYDNPKVINTSYSYDAYGNVISTTRHGDVSITGDEKYEIFEYAYNTTQWIVNKLKHYLLYEADNITKARESFYHYDNLSYGTYPTHGDLTQEEQWLGTGSNSSTRYEYDIYGNIVKKIDPRGYAINYVYNLRDTTSTYVDKITNPKGHNMEYIYDLSTGNILPEKDSNNYVTNYTYDSFGRKEKIILPYDTPSLPTRTYSYSFDGISPESIKISERINSGQSQVLDYYFYYDGFGNLIQTKSPAENSQQITIDIYYDPQKKVIRQSIPYFSQETTNYSSPNLTTLGINYTYDVLDRIIQIRNIDGTSTNTTFNKSLISLFDEKGNKKIYQIDAYDQIIKVVEYLSNNYFFTRYRYSPTGEILQIDDAYGNVYNYTYDGLGRKIKDENPDAGVIVYNYDSNGNLINQTYSANTTFYVQYDSLNRILNKTAQGGVINYIYDMINGTISSVNSSLYTTNYSYDQRLRKVKEIKKINGVSFIKEWSYDNLGNVKTETFPDGSVITYNHSLQNLPNRIGNIISSVEYNPLNKPTKISYANSLDTIYIYNSSDYRLNKIKTGNKQEISYTYDSIGNIIKFNDIIHNRIDNINYDTLSRIISVKRAINQSNYTFNYSINPVGNILNLNASDSDNLTLIYSSNPVHSPRKIVGKGCDNLNITSFAEKNSNESKKIWEIIIKNEDVKNLDGVIWKIVGTDIPILSYMFNLTSGESMNVYVNENLTLPQQYNITAQVFTTCLADQQILQTSGGQ